MLSSRFSPALLSRAQFTTIAALGHRSTNSNNIGKQSFTIHPCKIALDRPASVEDTPISFSFKGTILKDFFNCTGAGQARKASLDCVQCVEGFQSDRMNHCVPEWDGTGRELDSIWDPAESISPKVKWDTGQTKRPDMAFVPEYDFEELCWEDGELLIVMQGQNNKGNAKTRNGGQAGAGEPAPVSSGMQATAMDNSIVTPGSGDLTFPSVLNIHNQEDDLLAWLQHASDELSNKLDIPLDGSAPNGSWTSYDRLCSNTIVHHDTMKLSTLHEEETVAGSASRSLKHDTPFTYTTKVSGDHLDNEVNELSGPRASPSTFKSSKDQIEYNAVAHRNDMPPPQTHSGMAGSAYGSVSMNFSNFSRPAATYKASLHSIGMASGPSGAERLKQLDKIAGDKLKEESIDSTKKYFKPISPRREEDTPFQTVPNASQNVEASVIQQNTGSYSLWSEVEADISANEALNGSSRIVGKSNGWDSSIISSTALRTTDILGTVDRSDTFSSGGSEDFDGVDRKGSAKMSKRKFYEEDSDIQSKTLQSESTSTKKTATGEEISMKRRRVAENHNQSERRRRDRISEKMRALQSLIPNSHKSDKASMLEEAISYIKTLKSQLQMMSHRGGGVYFSPMLIPHGMQPMQMAAWPHMAMGMGMGMGMNIGTTGMGMLNMNMSGGPTNVRQYAPILPVPASGISAVNANPATSMDSTHPNTTHGMFVKHGFLSPAYPMMMPTQPGNPNSSACETLPTNISPYKILPLQQQQQSVEALTRLPQ